MEIEDTHLNRAIVRTVVIGVTGIGVGFALYRLSAFTPTMRAFQFVMSSVTIALAYAGGKDQNVRNGLAALFVWYVVLTGVIEEFVPWMLILNALYISGMAAATFVSQSVLKSRFTTKAVLRIAVGGAIISLANGLIIVLLGLSFYKSMVAHFGTTFDLLVGNLQLGALIGLATGTGMELAEYFIRRYLERPVDNVVDDAAGDKPVA